MPCRGRVVRPDTSPAFHFMRTILTPHSGSIACQAPTDTSLISEMEELETVLARRAEALGVKIKRGLAISDFHQTADGVTVQSGDQSFKGKWLVGCDGSRSVVRKAGGFEFAGTEPEFTGYSRSG